MPDFISYFWETKQLKNNKRSEISLDTGIKFELSSGSTFLIWAPAPAPGKMPGSGSAALLKTS